MCNGRIKNSVLKCLYSTHSVIKWYCCIPIWHGLYGYVVKGSLITWYRFCFLLIHPASPVLSGRRWAWPPEAPTALHSGSWRFCLLPSSAQKTLVFKNNCTALLQRRPSSRLLLILLAAKFSFNVLTVWRKSLHKGLALGNFKTGFCLPVKLESMVTLLKAVAMSFLFETDWLTWICEKKQNKNREKRQCAFAI